MLHLDVSPELLAGVEAVQALIRARGRVEAPIIVHDVYDFQVKALHSTQSLPREGPILDSDLAMREDLNPEQAALQEPRQ